MKQPKKGRVAAIREAWSAGTLDIEIARGKLSIFERQAILAVTSDGRSAGALPRGHRDDSRGRFSAGDDGSPDAEPRVIRWRPDEAVNTGEEAALNVVARFRAQVKDNPDAEEDASALAARELGLSKRQLRSRIESGNRKIRLRAERIEKEIRDELASLARAEAAASDDVNEGQ